MNDTLLSRAIRKVSRPLYRNLGIDAVTGLRTQRRNDIRRFGSDYGGWYLPASLLTDKSVCYCVGCGEDISFDLALIDEFQCQVFGFDPTPRAVRHVADATRDHSLYSFMPIGLWNQDTTLKFYEPRDPSHVSHSALNLQGTERFFEAPVMRLGNMMRKNGHTHLDLLKLDIEGAEYSVLESMLEDDLYVGILCVEYDECFQPIDVNYLLRIRRSIDALLAAGFVMTVAEGNGNYTFVHRDYPGS